MKKGRILKLSMLFAVFCLVLALAGCDNPSHSDNQFERANFSFTVTNNSNTTIVEIIISDGTGDGSHWPRIPVSIASMQTSSVFGPFVAEAAFGNFEYQIIILVRTENDNHPWGSQIWWFSGSNPPPHFISLNFPYIDHTGPSIPWTVTASGSPTTTALNFYFSSDPGNLTASDFTITSVTGSATRGILSGFGTTRVLTLTNVTAGTVSVSITGANADRLPRTVTLIGAAPNTLIITDVPTLTGNRMVNGFSTVRIFPTGTSPQQVSPAAGAVAVLGWGTREGGGIRPWTMTLSLVNIDLTPWPGSGTFDVFWIFYWPLPYPPFLSTPSYVYRINSVIFSSATTNISFDNAIRVYTRE